MKAVRFNGYGPAEVLYLAEVEIPAAGDGQVQLRVAAAGVNPADFKWRSGALHAMRPLSFPHIVGYDVAGTVTAVGHGVSGFKVGDRVAASVNCGYAEFAVADESACAKLPPGIEFDQAAALPCASLTGEQMIEEGVCPQKDQVLLITGATGGVGRFAVRAAVALGARVVAAVRPAYVDEARALGAHEAISLEDGDADRFEFDHAADTVGGPAAARLCRRVIPGGAIITVSTTPINPEGLPRPPSFFGYHPDGPRLARIMESVVRGNISMPVAHRIPFASAAVAHRLMEAGSVRGRIVLEP